MPWGVCQTLCRALPRVEQSLNLHRFWKVLTEILVSLLCPLKIFKKKSENYLWRTVISQASIFQTLTAKHWLPIKDGFVDCTTEDKVKSVFRNSMEICVWKIMIFLGECSTWPEEKERRGTKKSQGYILFSYCYESTEDLFKDRKPAHSTEHRRLLGWFPASYPVTAVHPRGHRMAMLIHINEPHSLSGKRQRSSPT